MLLLFLRRSDDGVGRLNCRLPHENEDTVVKFVSKRHNCIIRRIGREDIAERIFSEFYCVGARAFCVYVFLFVKVNFIWDYSWIIMYSSEDGNEQGLGCRRWLSLLAMELYYAPTHSHGRCVQLFWRVLARSFRA